MKVALLFVAVFVAVSHQQYFHPRMLFAGYPWFMPFPQQPDAYSNDFDSGNQDVHSEDSDRTIVGLIGSSRHNIPLFDELEEIPDIQSRVKGINRYRNRPYYSNNNDQIQEARLFFNLPNNGVTSSFNNPLFKTAFFTSTITLRLNAVQDCVPSTQVIANVAACRRRRRHYNYTTYNDEQFSIAPSETLNVTPTILSSSQLRNLDSLVLSSKDDSVTPDDALALDHLREKRFFINKNQFVVTSYSTTYVFINSTVTRTVNLLATAGGVSLTAPNCSPNGAGADGTPTPNGCVNCLPPGFVVCTAGNG